MHSRVRDFGCLADLVVRAKNLQDPFLARKPRNHTRLDSGKVRVHEFVAGARAPVPSTPTAKAYRGMLPYSICTAAERFAVAGLAHVAQTEAYAAVAGSIIREEVDGHAGIYTGVNVSRQQVGMDVGNMHALRLLLVTQCPLHSRTNGSPDGRVPSPP